MSYILSGQTLRIYISSNAVHWANGEHCWQERVEEILFIFRIFSGALLGNNRPILENEEFVRRSDEKTFCSIYVLVGIMSSVPWILYDVM